MDRTTREGLRTKAARLRWTAERVTDVGLAKAARRAADEAEGEAAGFEMNAEDAHDFATHPLRHQHPHDHAAGSSSPDSSYFRRHSHRHTHGLTAVAAHGNPRREGWEHQHGHALGEPAGSLYRQPLTNGQPVGLPRLVARSAPAEKSASPDLAKRYRRLSTTVSDPSLKAGYVDLARQLEEL